MAGKSLILAIDQGTTGTLVALFDACGKMVCQAYAEHTQHFPRPGWVEHDPQEILDKCLGLMKQAIASGSIGPGDLAAIGITNQRETVVLWDRATGRAVARAIVWQDRRTAGECQRLREGGRERLVTHKTGLTLDPYFSATKLAWLLDSDGALRQRAEKGELAAGTIDSWLAWHLTGGQAHVTDVTNASRTLLLNIHDLAWDAELLETFRVPAAVLPQVVPTSGIIGQTAPGIVPGGRVPVAALVGDQQAALFGQACHGAGKAKNTYGTGSFILMNTGPKPVASENRLLTTVAWRLGSQPADYALEGSIFVTGAAVQWLRDGLGIIRSAGETQAMAESLPGNEGVYFVPALTGLGAPYWDPLARGAIVGLTRGTTASHLVRAALEAMAYQTRDVVEAMQRDSSVTLTELRADGGAVGNGFLMQFQADILGVPVAVAGQSQTTALGAAYLAGLATGVWKDQREIDAQWQPGRRYEPRMAPSQRDELYAQWKRAVARARDWAKG